MDEQELRFRIGRLQGRMMKLVADLERCKIVTYSDTYIPEYYKEKEKDRDV